MAQRPPGSKIPGLAQLAWYMLRPVQYLERMRRRYGDIFHIPSPIFGHEIAICRPETIREVFRGDGDVFRGGEANDALAVLVGPASVLVLDGTPHRRQRKLLMPPFHGERMRSYTDTMREQTLRAMRTWREGEVITLQPEMRRITLDIIMRAVLGMADDARLEKLRASLEVMLVGPTSAIGVLPMIPALQRDLGPWWPWAAFKRTLDETDAMIIQQIHDARERGIEGRSDILSLLLSAVDEDGEPMTDQELRDELMTLLVAGHETTAVSLCWAFEQILGHRDVRNKVIDELNEVIGDGEVEASHVSELRYLDAAIRESLRLRPIIPMFGRKLSRGITLQGYDIPAGDMVAPCPWLLHREPDLYPEPEEFRPERFVDHKPDPYEWIPFGGGARRCIGMAFALHEMKVVLATVLSQKHIQLAQDEPSPIVLRGFVFAPKGGSRVFASSRNRA
jgi:cytochrome P450